MLYFSYINFVTLLWISVGSSIEYRSMSNNCSCGRRISTKRIFGGTESKINSYPWMVAVIINRRGILNICGGSLINDRYVLTAAHCTKRSNTNDVMLLLGDHDLLNSEETNSITTRAIKIREHLNYRKTNLNDIALIEFNASIEAHPYIRPICLPESTMNLTGILATVAGWGKLSFVGHLPFILQETDVKIINNNQCANYYKYADYKINSKDICAGGKKRDACTGDSGGPLFIKDGNNNYIQVGIVRSGIKCGSTNFPGLYTRVDKYLGWIKEHTKNAHYCVQPHL